MLTGPELADVTGSLGSAERDSAAADTARARLRRGATVTERTEEFLLDLWVPVPSVLIVGSGAIGAALAAQAALLGWTARAVADLDETVAAVAAFTDADVLVLLDHGPEFDAALIAGLRGRGFIGALGSRHTQSARRERLLAAGVTEDELARLYGPVGLDLGARTAAETAVSIVAQVIAVRGGRAGCRAGRLRRAASADDRDRPAPPRRPGSPGSDGWCCGAVVVALFVVGGTAFRVWQVARQDDRQTADAVVVLGAAQYDGHPSSIFAARLKHAAALYDDKLAPRIVTTGGGRPATPTPRPKRAAAT